VALLSSAEKDFVRAGVAVGVRPDGRECLESRGFSVQLGVVPNAHGSAVVQCGGTRVVVGVKAEFAAMDRAAPRKGRIEAAVTCSATASPLFEGRAGEEVSAELSFVLNRMLSDGLGAAAYEQLHISDDLCWHLYADAVVLQHDGSLLDCASMAIHAALADTLVPLTTLGKNEDGSVHVEIHDSRTAPVLDMAHVPLFITLAQVGQGVVADALAAEEACAAARLSIGVSEAGRVAATHKADGRALNPTLVSQMLKAACKLGVSRIKQLRAACAEEIAARNPAHVLDYPLFA